MTVCHFNALSGRHLQSTLSAKAHQSQRVALEQVKAKFKWRDHESLSGVTH